MNRSAQPQARRREAGSGQPPNGRPPARRQKPGRRRFSRAWLLLIPFFGVVGLASMYLSIAWNLTPPPNIILGAQGLEILDRNGQVIYTFGEEPGSSRIVPLEEISPHLINATVATEDANYWNHPGVNFRGIARAAYENIAFWEKGGVLQGSGGSSITQQLAKNLYISPDERDDRSLLRKLKETMLAFELTRRYSKQQILEWYLSHIFYGQGAYGIEAASFRYLDKPPADLTLGEAALLAGLPRAPNFYDPITNFEAAKARQEEVLSLMVRHHFISQEEADQALAEEITIREGRIPDTEEATDVGIHFALYVRDLLPELIGQEAAVGQLRVTTTLDLGLQAQAEETVASHVAEYEAQGIASNGALVAIDPSTGEILAMVGSQDFNRSDISGQVNNAVALNQPGSSIKPVTYLTAFLKGWTPDTMVVDEPYQLGNGENAYVVGNADGVYRGTVSVRNALGSSLNVPAVKALEFAGLENVYAIAERLGISTLHDVSFYGPAFTLGGVDVTLLDMAYVYSVLANEGVQAGVDSRLNAGRPRDPIAILRVETADGQLLYEADHGDERVVPADAVAQITDILSDDTARYSMFGPGSPLYLRSRPAAVKSGLTDDARDAWAIGYTPNLAVGVWVGNANNEPMQNASSTYTAAPIWNAFMEIAHAGLPVVGFGQPQTPVQAEPPTATPEPPTPEPTSTPEDEDEAEDEDEEDAPPTPTVRPRRDATSTPFPTATPRPTRTSVPSTSTPDSLQSTPVATSTSDTQQQDEDDEEE